MHESNLVYGIHDTPATIKEWVLYAAQQLMAVFVATVLIANICGTPISSCFLGGAIGTIVYQIVTNWKSPMFISNSGATCSAVIGALALGTAPNYLMVFVGGLVIALVYCGVALLIRKRGIQALDRVFPPSIVGAVTIVIGLNLAGYIPTYVQVMGSASLGGIAVAFATMFIIAIASHYFKGFWKTVPFLFGLLGGYAICLILEACGIQMIDWAIFDTIKWYPDLTFLQWSVEDFSWANVLQTIILFAPVAICALLEHYSDHKVLSNIIGTDLTKEPGLHRTLIGDGIASAVGTMICGLPNTSYGESIATTGFSRVASVKVVTLAALFMAILAFIGPLQAFIQSIPSCVFGGCAMILYGYIACSGLKTLMRSKIDLDNNRNLIIVSVILTVGVGGLVLQFGSFSFAGVALSMVAGVALNLILKTKGDE